jgi:hypothetical protein
MNPPLRTPVLHAEDRAEITRLEEAMWRTSMRFDLEFQEKHFAPDFFEFGRSGRTYTRQEVLLTPTQPQPIHAVLPLPKLQIRLLDDNTAQVTYDSQVTYGATVEHAHRSSIWSRTSSGWVMRFHQGTPYEP